jgi:hypothetical protein
VNLGAEPKKVVALGVLIVIGLVGYYVNSTGDSTVASAPRAVSDSPSNTTVTTATPARPRTSGRGAVTEFHPKVGGNRPEDVDPELKMDLLAKVQAVQPIEAGRNLFQFGAAPPPPGSMPDMPKNVAPILVTHQQTPLTVTPTNTTPPTPQAPPINLKYYGFKVSKTDGHTVAFLLDGDDIMIVTENETVKQRYKIVRIARTSIVIEDTQAKSTQTLTLQDTPT